MLQNKDNGHENASLDSIKAFLETSMFMPGDFNLQTFVNQKTLSRNTLDAANDALLTEDSDANVISKSVQELRGASGILFWDHHVLGIKSKLWKDVAALKPLDPTTSYEKCVFKKFPFKSRLFEYHIEGNLIPNHPAIAGRDKVIQCVNVTTKPRPLTKDVLDIILDLIGMTQYDDLCDFFAYGEWINDTKYHMMTPDERDNVYEFKFDDIIASLRLTGKRVCIDKFYNEEELKRYFQHQYVDALKDFFDIEFILSMDWIDIPDIYKTLTTNPHVLCFATDEHTFRHKVPKRYEAICESSFITEHDGKIRLYEMNYNGLIDAYVRFEETIKTEHWNIAAALIYDEMKVQTFEGKHAYTPIEVIRKSCIEQESPELSKSEIQKAFDWLHAKKLIVIDSEERVFLTKLYAAETSIVKSLEYLFNKAVMAKYTENTEEYDEEGNIMPNTVTPEAAESRAIPKCINIRSITSHKGYKLCSEQAKAFLTIQNSPIVVIDGPGGSGLWLDLSF